MKKNPYGTILNGVSNCLGYGSATCFGNYNTILNGLQNKIGTCNSTSATCFGLASGCCNQVNHNFSTVIGKNITTTTSCTFYTNNSTITCHLQVGGTTTLSSTTGRIDATNDIVAYSTSDCRLKENIKPIDNALCKLVGVSGNTFNWKPLTEEEVKEIHGHSGKDVGVIAQEIEEILPEAVTTRDSGYKAVNYEKIVPLLIEAIKDQQKQIDELKSKL
jgi:hypothetical protein